MGKFEAVSFADGGAFGTAKLVKEYSKIFLGVDAGNHSLIAKTLRGIDDTPNYSRIGGSAAYGISIAAADAASKSLGKPFYKILDDKGPYSLPYPLGNVLGGGKHAGPGSTNLQEFLVCPVGAKNIMDALNANACVHKNVFKRIVSMDPNFTGGKNDEGGWAPKITDEDAIKLVSESAETVGEELGLNIRIGVDFAASSLWNEKENKYVYDRSSVRRSKEDQKNFVEEMATKYNMIYIEDPFHEDDFDSFADLMPVIGDALVTGDDLFVTSSKRLIKGASIKAGNAAILKVNQVGSLGDALNFVAVSRKTGYSLVTSHRSGDSLDNHLAHIAVGTGSVMMKSGVVGGERVAKLNELVRINEYNLITHGRNLPMISIR